MPFGLKDIWTITSRTIYHIGKRVGIGTTDPQHELDVVGELGADKIYEDGKLLKDVYVEKIGKEKFTDVLISDIPQDQLLKGEDVENFESNLAIRFRFDRDDFLSNSATEVDGEGKNQAIRNMYKISLLHHDDMEPMFGNHYIIGDASAYFNGEDMYYVMNNNDTSVITTRLTRWDIIDELTFTFWLRLEIDEVDKKHTILHFKTINLNEYIWVYIEDNYFHIEWKSSYKDKVEINNIVSLNKIFKVNEWFHITFMVEKK